MATTDADQTSGDHQLLHHQIHDDDQTAPPPLAAAHGGDLGIDKISKEEATKEVSVGDDEPPAVPSLADEVEAMESVPAEVEAPPAPVPVESPDTTAAAPASSLEASPALEQVEEPPHEPIPLVEHLPQPEEEQALNDDGVAEAQPVATEPGEKPDSLSAPTESDDKLEAAVVHGQVKAEEAPVEVEPSEKTDVEGEATDSPPEPQELAQEIESSAKQVVAGEEREIDPVPSSEATDEPTSELKDLPVADSEPEKKEEHQEVAEPQVDEKVVPSPADEVTTDGPVEEYSESAAVAQVAGAVPAKDVAEDSNAVDQIAALEEPAVVEPHEPEAVPTTNDKDVHVKEASTETLVPDAEKAAVVERNTVAEGLPLDEAEKTEEGVEEKIAEPKELVSSGTENGTDVVEEKLKVESVQEDEIKQVAEEVAKADEATGEKIGKLEEFPSSGTENGADVVEEKSKDESVLEEEAEVVAKGIKADEVTGVKTEKPEELVSSGIENGTNVVEEELKDESLVEKEAKDVKATEVTEMESENPEELVSNGTENGNNVIEKEVKDESLVEDVKAEEVVADAGDVSGSILDKDVADEHNLGAAAKENKVAVEETNETESVKEVTGGKPSDPSALEPPKADDNVSSRDLPVTEVITKTTAPKSSGNIISKVKQSLVKVKKAITGKSPASKTTS